jgi:hypothetical protein
VKNPTITFLNGIIDNHILIVLPERDELRVHSSKFAHIFNGGGGCSIRRYSKKQKELGEWRSGWKIHAERSTHEITFKLHDSQEMFFASVRFDIEDYVVRAPLGLSLPCAWDPHVLI